MKIPRLAVLLGLLTGSLLGWARVTGAETYQLQVASIPEHVFMYFVEGRTLPHVDEFLGTRRSRFVVFLDRQPQPLETASEKRAVSFPVNVTLPKRDDPWGVMSWDKGSGPLAVFVIRGKQRA